MDIETNRTRPLSELSDAELIRLILGGRIDVIVEAILVFRGHPRLTPDQRHQLQQLERGESRQLLAVSEMNADEAEQ
jgi:hypothetical protein